MRLNADLILYNIGELLTLSGTSEEPVRLPTAKTLGVLNTDGLCVASSGGRIAYVGRRSDLNEDFATGGSTEIDCHGKLVMPGFVDSHTHSIFAGSREGELSSKLSGMSYLEILKSGGGILKTVRETNQAADSDLLSQTLARLERMGTYGTTTFEVKTGYSLTVSGEIRLLELLERIRKEFGFDVVSTLLSAHAIPEEYTKKTDIYISEVVMPSINVAAERGLAKFCDVFLEEGVFGYAESESILSHASRVGFSTKIHADEFSDQRGAELGAKVGVVSADHLGRTSLEGASLLAGTSAVAVLLPGTLLSSFVATYAKARQFIDLGLPVAIATDMSPNSWIESMQFVVSLACYGMRMTVEEAIVAATINGAHAISRGNDVGSIEVGKRANLLLCQVENYRQVPYRIASNIVAKVIRDGKLSIEND
jgi:imidazolonepropionase